ncbi:NCS2 family permease, partial [Candidatus Pseudothioglobus singularis]|nr:NCS2 family permease [Candidatus Pseudothioglobus singularis]
VFALTMVLVFENIGLVYGQTKEAEQPEKYKDGIRVVAISATVSGVFGSSPTVSTAEGAAGIAAGGRTGVTAIVTGILFLLSFFLLPFIEVIPASAISPILIIIGFLMVLNIKNINLQDLSEAIPAFLIIMMIPFSYSIADGMAIGFLAYPIAKLALGKGKEVSVPLYVIAGLFLVYFVSQGF